MGMVKTKPPDEGDIDIAVTLIHDPTASIGWDKLWQRLLQPLPDEPKAVKEEGDDGNE